MTAKKKPELKYARASKNVAKRLGKKRIKAIQDVILRQYELRAAIDEILARHAKRP